MLKSIAKISSVILLLLVFTFVLLYWQSNFVASKIIDLLNSKLEGIAKIEYSKFSGNLFETVEISDLFIILEDSSTIEAKSLKVDYNLTSIIFQPYLIRDFSIEYLSVNLKEKGELPVKKELKTFTINDIPTILDSLIVIDSLLAVFPELIITRGKISNANLKLSKELNFENINLNIRYAFDSVQLDILIESLTGIWKNRDLNVSKFQTEFNANKNRITINKLQLETNNSYLNAKAEFSFSDKNWIILDLEDSHLEYLDVSKFTSLEDITKGWINTSLQIVGSPNNLSAQLSLNGETDRYKIDSLIADIDFKDKTLSVLAGKILINNTFLTFAGKGSVESSYGKINFNKFNISNLVPDVINTSLTGNISFNVDELDFNHLNGSGEIYLVNSVIDSVKIDSLRFALIAEDNNFDIVDPSILKFGDKSLFKVKGNLDRKLNINAELFTENNDLAQLFPALNFDTLHGNFDANLTMTGNIMDPDLHGYLFLPFFAKDSIQLDTIILDLRLKKIFSSRKGDAYFSIIKGDVQGFELTEALVNISFDSNKVLFDTLRFANNENYISLAGILEQNQDTFNLGFNLIRINYQNYWIENSDSVLINFYPDEFIINQAFFKAPGSGVLEIRGFWDNKIEDMQIGLYVENIKIDPFQQFVTTDQSFSGVLNGEVVLIEPFHNPNIESEVEGASILFSDASMGNISMDVEYDNGNIYFREFVLDNGTTHFYAHGDIALKFIEKNNNQTIDFIEGTETNLSVQWENFDLNQYQQILKMKNPVMGASSGTIEISGSIKKPEVIAKLKADSIVYEKYVITDLNLKTHYKDGFIVLDSLQSEINQTFISANGKQKIDMDLAEMKFELLDRPMDLNIYSKDDRIDFLGNFLDQVEKISGEYETNIHIGGSPEKPIIDSGFFKIENGNIVLSRVKNPISGLTINATIQDSILTINNLVASSVKDKDIWEQSWSYIISFFRLFKGETSPEGQLLADGTINLSDIQHPEIDLNLAMDEFFVDYFVENTQMVISSDNLHITGRDTLNIIGNLIVEKGKYDVDLDKLRKNIFLTSTELNPDKAISWNLEINIPDNFIIASSTLDLVNNFELEISGDMRAIQEPNSPNMELTGHVEILSGNYLAFGQNFEIQQGSIDFANPKKINPDIEIYAEKATGDYTVELSVNGNLDRIMQDLQIRDANGNYLTNLSLYDKLSISGSGDAGLVNTGEELISTSMYNVFERGTQDLTGLDKVQIEDSKSLIDLQSGKLNNGLEDASISIGKYLTNNLYLEYRSQFGSGAIPVPKLSWESGNQISLAYKINKFWSVESAYAQTLKGNTLINISLAWKTTF
jgi:hypothetical protein